MSISYLLTSPKPEIEGADAVFQELALLSAAFDGTMLNLHPMNNPGSRFPRQLFGFHVLAKLRKLEKSHDFNHIYYPELYAFPVLRFLKKQIIFTVTASLNPNRQPAGLSWLKGLHKIIVSNKRDAKTLADWGFSNFVIVPPSIDTTKIEPGTLPLKNDFHLLMASAPWVEKQFDLKGIDALLEAVRNCSRLNLTLLWRGLLVDELHSRIDKSGIAGRVTVVNERVEISDWLAKCHATILLAKSGDIVKAYPHSLLESLIAQKPVIISKTIPMADLVEECGCGIVLENVNASSVIEAIDNLVSDYTGFVKQTKTFGQDAFSKQKMIDAHKEIYSVI